MSELLKSDNNPLSTAATHRLRVSALILSVIAAIVLAAILVHRQRVSGLRAGWEGVATADGARVAVAIYHARAGAWPPDNSAAGLLSPSAVEGKYVSHVQISEGHILITLGRQTDRKLRGDISS